MLRVVTLSNSPDCVNRSFNVFQSTLTDRFLFDTLQVNDVQIFPTPAFDIYIPLSDSLGVNDNLIWAGKDNHFVTLTDGLDIRDVFILFDKTKTHFVTLRDKIDSITDEYDTTKTNKTITISLTESLNLQE